MRWAFSLGWGLVVTAGITATATAVRAGDRFDAGGDTVSHSIRPAVLTEDRSDNNLFPDRLYLRFTMLRGGPLPATQYVSPALTGRDSIRCEIVSGGEWIVVAPGRGSVADSIAVAIAPADLEPGRYEGAIRLFDGASGDGVLVIAVTLDILRGSLELSADTVRFVVPAGYDTTLYREIAIRHDGKGTVSWTASDNAPWLSLSSTSGQTPTRTFVAIDGRALPVGEYAAALIVTGRTSATAPDTMVVVLVVKGDIPVIAVEPAEIAAVVEGYRGFDTSFTIRNDCGGRLDWVVDGVPPWLTVLPLSGSGPGTVGLSVNHGALEEGLNGATLMISDPAAYNGLAKVVVRIDYRPPAGDTFFVGSVVLPAGGEGIIELTARVNNELAEVSLPLSYDPARMSIDSIQFGPELPVLMERHSRIDPSTGVFLVRLEQAVRPASIEPGVWDIARVYFSAGMSPGWVVIDAGAGERLPAQATLTAGPTLTPVVAGGTVTVVEAEGSPDGRDETSPISLLQNYPNPFNSSTVVAFNLPDRTEVRLEVYNVLGRRVAVLAEGPFGAGSYEVSWGGVDEAGREAPSGVYFYRLQTPDTSLVAKMILVK